MGKSGGASQTYVYYGTIACGVCIGPVDDLISIVLNGEEVWPQGTPWTGVGGTSTAGTLYVYDAQTWICTTTVTNTANNAPGGSDLTPGWSQYTLPRPSLPTVYTDISITTSDGTYYGVLRFYWGTQTTADYYLSAGNNDGPGLTGAGGGDQHPSYAGLCYIVLIDFLFGQEIQSAPNVEIVVRKAPTQTVVTGAPAALTNGQANLAAVIADLLTNPNCIGLPAADLDATSFNAVATYLQTQSAICGASVIVDSTEQLRSVMQKCTDLFDGYIRFNPSTGLIELGVYEHGVTPATYTTMTEDSLTEAPKIKTTSWQGTYSRATVRYPDRQLNYQQTSLHADDARAWTVLKSVRDMQLDRPYITIGTQALAHGREMLRLLGHAQTTAQISVRREIARTIRPGDYVLLDVDIEPNTYTVSAFFRVTKMTIPMTGPMKLELLQDNTLATVPALSTGAPAVPVTTAVPAITQLRILEVPTVLSGEVGAITVLAVRPNALVVGGQLYFDTTRPVPGTISSLVANGSGLNGVITFSTAHSFQVGDNLDVSGATPAGFNVMLGVVTATTTYTVTYALSSAVTASSSASGTIVVDDYSGSFALEGTFPSYAAYATLHTAVLVTDGTITVNVAAQTDEDYLTNTWSATQAANDTMLAILVSVVASGGDTGEVAESSGYPIIEIMSVSTQTLVSAGVYTLTVLRGRQNTEAAAWTTANTEVWLIPRALLAYFNDQNFNQIRANRQAGLTPAYAQFRVCPYTFTGQYQLSDAANIQFRFPVNSYTVPSLTMTTPSSFNALTYSSVSTYPFFIQLNGTWSDPNGALVETTVSLTLTGNAPRIVQDITFHPVATRALGAAVQIDGPGSYLITLTARDASNLTITQTIPVNVTGSGAKCALPDLFDSSGNQVLNPNGVAAIYQAWDFLAEYESEMWGIVTDANVPFGPMTLTCSTPGATITFRARIKMAAGVVSSVTSSINSGATLTYSPTLKPVYGLLGPNDNLGTDASTSSVWYGWVMSAQATAPGYTASDTIYFAIRNLH